MFPTANSPVFFSLANFVFGEKHEIGELRSVCGDALVSAATENGFARFNNLDGRSTEIDDEQFHSIVRDLLALEKETPDQIFLCSETLFSCSKRPAQRVTGLSESVFSKSPYQHIPIMVVTGNGCANVSRALAWFAANPTLSSGWVFAIETFSDINRLRADRRYVLSDGAMLIRLSREPHPGAYALTALVQKTTHGISSYRDGSIRFIRTHRRHSRDFLKAFQKQSGLNLSDYKTLVTANYSKYDMRFCFADLGLELTQLYRPTLSDHGHILSIDTYANLVRLLSNGTTNSPTIVMSLANSFWDVLLVVPESCDEAH